MTSALAAGVIMAAIPAVVALMSVKFLRERITHAVAAGIACAVGGIILVSVTAPRRRVRPPGKCTGNLLLVAAVCCEASYVVIGKRLTSNVGAKRISSLVNLWGLVLVTPLGLWQALRFDFDVGRPGVSGRCCCRLFARCQHGDRVAVDDGPEARAGIVGGCFHGAAAGERRGGRRDLSRRAFRRWRRRAAFGLALLGVRAGHAGRPGTPRRLNGYSKVATGAPRRRRRIARENAGRRLIASSAMPYSPVRHARL